MLLSWNVLNIYLSHLEECGVTISGKFAEYCEIFILMYIKIL